jgi:hypothetical protein
MACLCMVGHANRINGIAPQIIRDLVNCHGKSYQTEGRLLQLRHVTVIQWVVRSYISVVALRFSRRDVF